MINPRRQIWFGLGIICVGLGFVGFAVPGIPGVVFMAIAAWAFSKSSNSWRNWILNHPQFGETVRNWALNRSLSRRLKYGLTLSMLPTSIFAAWLIDAAWLQAGVGAGMIFALVYIWTRPSSA